MRLVFREILSGLALVAVTGASPLTGHAAQQARLMARAAATQMVEFDVFLPLEHRAELERTLDALHDPSSPEFHKWLKPEEFNARFGVQPDKLSAIQNELASHGLTVSMAGPRQLHVSGSAKRVENTFASELKNGVFPNGKRTVAFSRPFLLPSSISAADGIITGLSGKIWMRTHSAAVAQASLTEALPDNRYGPTGGYWFTDLKQAYSFPSVQAYDGTGVVIGVLMSGGFQLADMTKYFGFEKIAPPKIAEIKISGGAPFGTPDSLETALDLEQTGGMAPNAQLVLYNLPDLSNLNILTALVRVVETNAVDVLSMSFGEPERFFTPEYSGQDETGTLQIYDDLFAQGNAQGITFVASSGDSGALPIPPLACFEPMATGACGSMQPGISTPASSPHVTAVGGTNLVTGTSPSAPLSSPYVSENADGDPLTNDIFYGTPATGAVWGSGGGDSIYFKKPAFQKLSATGSKFRTVPDVSLHMGGCPGGSVRPCGPDRSFDYLVWNNLYYRVIGTSASAPDFAGLLALKIQRDQSRQGNVNYTLYADSAEQTLGIVSRIFRKNVPGYNGYYSTKPGYDRVTGLGTIRGLNFLQAPAGTPVAGVPQTPSNP